MLAWRPPASSRSTVLHGNKILSLLLVQFEYCVKAKHSYQFLKALLNMKLNSSLFQPRTKQMSSHNRAVSFPMQLYPALNDRPA